MRVTLLVLGVALLCAVATAQQSRGRERLRELVQKARAGDVEAQTILASRRRKIIRNQGDQQNARGPVANAREDEAIANILAGPARRPSFSTPSQDSQPVRTRLPLSRRVNRPRNRGGSRAAQAQSEVTTFRPTITTTEAPLPPTTAAPEISPIPLEEVFTPAETLPESPSQVADLTPTNIIPSIFQSAQFGAGGRGVQAGPDPVIRTEPVRQEVSRQTFRPRSRQEPHRAIQRGLETGTRSEVQVVDSTTDEQRIRTPPVQTTRRYSYFDEAGNYVFGYEAEDGSFKEEIRGLDCIVNGKYGYIDPTGIRREFTYVSGNKCDPNDPEGLQALEGVTIPPNDQFLHQTQARVLSEAELSQLSFNRRRQNVPQTQTNTVPQRASRPRPVSRPRTRPTPAPVAPVQQEPQPIETVAAPEANQERFPVPDFISGNRAQSARRPAETPRRPEVSRPQEPTRQQPELQPRPELPQTQPPRPPRPQPSEPADLTPTNVIPSLFQPAQFGAGGRGVPPASTFNFEQEFQSVFSNFDNRGTGFVAQTVRTTPRPRPTTPRPLPTTRRPPPPPTTTRAPPPSQSGGVPSLFQPAQFGSNQPARPSAPLDDNAFTLAPQQSSGLKQLVFDASTGTFKTVQVQNSGHFTPASLPVQPAPTHRPTPRPTPRPTTAAPRNNPPPRQTTGRPLQIFSSNPLPPIPTSAAEFDQFFSSFTG